MSTGNLEIQEHCTENDPLAPDLLSVGSCGLHVLHSAFINTGQNQTCCRAANKVFSIVR